MRSILEGLVDRMARILTDTRNYRTLGILVPHCTIVTLSPCHAFFTWTLPSVLVTNLSHRSVRVAVTRCKYEKERRRRLVVFLIYHIQMNYINVGCE